MDTISGHVVFRNQMGSTMLLKVRTVTERIETLHFNRDLLGDRYEAGRALELGEAITAEVTPSTRAWRVSDVLDVHSFARVPNASGNTPHA